MISRSRVKILVRLKVKPILQLNKLQKNLKIQPKLKLKDISSLKLQREKINHHKIKFNQKLRDPKEMRNVLIQTLSKGKIKKYSQNL